jgi:hypothetical protein
MKPAAVATTTCGASLSEGHTPFAANREWSLEEREQAAAVSRAKAVEDVVGVLDAVDELNEWPGNLVPLRDLMANESHESIVKVGKTGVTDSATEKGW